LPQSPDLVNETKAVRKRRISEELQMEVKKAAGDCPKHAVACNIPGHKLTNRLVCKGLNTPSNFGRWFQVVSSRRVEEQAVADDDPNNSARHANV